jgi:NAD(P)-dependent dehydrogenase (short-subunit alcohol dehydrogenase family)
MPGSGTQAQPKTIIVTGASQGIGTGVTKAFLERRYNVVANSRQIRKSALAPSERLALVEGDIGEAATAARIAATAMSQFGSIDGVVNNAGIFFGKRFTDFTDDDFDLLSKTNLRGFLYITQVAVKQMLAQGTGGSITTVTATTAEHPIAPANGSLPMMTKGGLEALTRNLALEYAPQKIRFNAVAPGIVDTPMQESADKDILRGFSPMGTISSVDDVAAAIVYLTEAPQVTGEIIHVDGGAHVGKW